MARFVGSFRLMPVVTNLFFLSIAALAFGPGGVTLMTGPVSAPDFFFVAFFSFSESPSKFSEWLVSVSVDFED